MQKILIYLFAATSTIVSQAQFATQELDNLNTTTGTAINQSLVVGNSTTTPFPPLELDLGTNENPWRSLYFTEEGDAFIYLYNAVFMHNTGGTISGGYRTGVFLGENAGENVTTTANGNVGIGYQAMQNSESGSHNTAVGWLSLKFLANGKDMNTMIGSRAGQAILNGERNTGIGWNVFFDGEITTTGSINGSQNVGIGGEIFKSLINGSNNTVIGHASGLSLTDGSNNVIIGQDAGNDLIGDASGEASNNIIIGYQQELSPDAESEMNIGGVLYAELDEGKVSIGNSSGELTNTWNVGDADQFQLSSDGVIEQYNNEATEGSGVAYIRDVFSEENTATQTETIASNLAEGRYRITYYLKFKTVTATQPYTLNIRALYDDKTTGNATVMPKKNISGINQMQDITATGYDAVSGTWMLEVEAGTNIQIKTTLAKDSGDAITYIFSTILERMD